MSQALRARNEKAEITYADFRNEVLAAEGDHAGAAIWGWITVAIEPA
jgi:hypothetical protein